MTSRHLLPIQGEIFDYLLAMRLDLDAELSAQYPMNDGKPYPLGRCREITCRVREELAARLHKPEHKVEVAIRTFLQAGGAVRPIWGVLRGLYFQNATQFGTLYIDVSNDTVDIRKPKVEILPIEACQLEAIRDIAHFGEAAGHYWKMKIYPNVVVPWLAPLLPILGISENGQIALHSATDYMVALMMADGFRAAESWIRTGPLPPEASFRRYLGTVQADWRPTDSQAGRQAALAAIMQARAQGCQNDMDWRDAMMIRYLRLTGRPVPPA